MQTVKVKPWGDGQGDHVLINESDFDPEKHELFGAAPVNDAACLRDAYQSKFGKRPFMGWDAETIRAKIEAAE